MSQNMNKKLDCDCQFDVIELDLIEDQVQKDYVRGESSGQQKWEGKIESAYGTFDFTFERDWYPGNSGYSVEINSKKPDTLSENEWDELKDLMKDFLYEDWSKNRKDWEEVGDY